MVLFASRDPGDEPVLFHYTGAEKLALILTSQRLWLSPYSAMRDPLEDITGRARPTRGQLVGAGPHPRKRPRPQQLRRAGTVGGARRGCPAARQARLLHYGPT